MSDLSGGQELTMRGAAFDVFRNRGRSGVLIGATVGYIILVIAVVAAFALTNMSGVAAYASWYMEMLANPSAPPQLPPQVLGLIPAYMLVMFASYILLAAYEAAILRWLVRGETGGFLGFTLGADTWRIWFGYWIWAFLLVCLYIVVIIAMVVVGGALGVAGVDAGMMALALGLASVASLGFFVWICVRFAPAAATSVARNKFAFFDAWKVSRGRFWSLFGSFLLLILLLTVFIAVVVGAGIVLLMGGSFAELARLGTPPTSADLAARFGTPSMIAGIAILYLLYFGVFMVFYVALMGVNARAALVAKAEGRIS